MSDATPQPSSEAAAALHVEHLSFAYERKRKALDDVSFAVQRGSFTALLGPNGAGKTTLMALVTRLFHSRDGRILVDGRDMHADPRAALSAMGVVFQRLTLDLDISVAENLRYAAALHGLAGADRDARIAALAQRMGLSERMRDKVRALSGGMRRRVELARALLHRPRLLVLDEPTVGLDIDSRRSIVEHVHALCREEGLAVLWTTHLIDEIQEGDAVVVICQGKVVAKGGLADLLRQADAANLDAAFKKLTGASNGSKP